MTGVTDSTITVAEALANEAADDNVTITGPGEPPIENVFAQRYWAVGITFQPMFLQREDLYSAGDVTVSATGTTATFPRAHGLVAGDLLRITSGIAAGRARTVKSVDSATQVTLSEQFDKPVSNAAYAIGKSVKDIGLQLCILDNTESNFAQTQWGCCMSHVVMRRCTHLGSLFHVRDGLPEFGAHGVAVTDCIFEKMQGDGSGSAIPSDGLRVDNNVFEVTPTQGTNAILGDGVGTTVNSSTYRPTANSDANNQLEDARNYLGYDYYGDVTDTSQSNKSIGAVGEP